MFIQSYPVINLIKTTLIDVKGLLKKQRLIQNPF